jgi:hypothetical protein
VCRFPAASPWTRWSVPSAGLHVTRHHRGFTVVHPSGLPLRLWPLDGTAALGLDHLSFAPRRYRRRTSGWGQAIEHRPGLHLRHVDLQSMYPLNSCDLVSHLEIVMMRESRIAVVTHSEEPEPAVDSLATAVVGERWASERHRSRLALTRGEGTPVGNPTPQQVGTAGEHFVAGEILRRGGRQARRHVRGEHAGHRRSGIGPSPGTNRLDSGQDEAGRSDVADQHVARNAPPV